MKEKQGNKRSKKESYKKHSVFKSEGKIHSKTKSSTPKKKRQKVIKNLPLNQVDSDSPPQAGTSKVSTPLKAPNKSRILKKYYFMISGKVKHRNLLANFIGIYGGNIISRPDDLLSYDQNHCFYISDIKDNKGVHNFKPYVSELVFHLVSNQDALNISEFECTNFKRTKFSDIDTLRDDWEINVLPKNDWLVEENNENISLFENLIVQEYNKILETQNIGSNERESETLCYAILYAIVKLNSEEPYSIFPQFCIPKVDVRWGSGKIDFIIGNKSHNAIRIRIVMETKQENTFLDGYAQCISETLACYSLNFIQNLECDVFGILSDGFDIQFFHATKNSSPGTVRVFSSERLHLMDKKSIRRKLFKKGQDFNDIMKILVTLSLPKFKDSLIRKITFFSERLDEKDKEIKEVIEEKDKEIKEVIDEKDKVIEEKEKVIELLKKELLSYKKNQCN
jgi:hypothetical protein